jgi:DNA primase
MNCFEFIKQRLSILDVAQEYTALKKAGNYWKGRCPFHHEKTASFTISPHKEIFYCFGCQAGGDLIALVARMEQCTQIEAAKLIAERFNIELPAQDNFVQGTATMQKKVHYFAINALIAQWAHEWLLRSPEPRDYLETRGFKEPIIKQFMLGYFPDGTIGMKDLFSYAKKHALLVQDLVDAHIIMYHQYTHYSPFEERILFPIKDHVGRYCGFGGRIYKNEDNRVKYYNTKESDFFLKGSLVFGLDQAKTSIQEKRSVFMVEGYTDCIAMVQHGLLNTIATLGTACTQYHLKALSRYADTLYVLYDADDAGIQAVLRLTQLCWQVSMELKVVTLPAGTDPASFLQGNGHIQGHLAAARDIFLFYVEAVSAGFKTASLAQKMGTIQKLIEIIGAQEDPLKRDLVLYQASQVLDIPVTILAQELRRVTNSQKSIITQQDCAQEAKNAPIEPTLLEKKLVCAILHNVAILDEYEMRYVMTYLPHPLSDYVQALCAIPVVPERDSFNLFYEQQTSEVQGAISALLCTHEPETDKRAAKLLFAQWQRQQWRRIVTDIKERIADATLQGQTQIVQNLLEEFNQIKKSMIGGTPSSLDTERSTVK